ncbi:MAG: endo-1,4-beta-xylanase [Anaerolineales bacterium]
MKSPTVLFLLTLLFSACAPAATPAHPVETAVPSATVTAVVPTLPPTLTPVSEPKQPSSTPTAIYSPIELSPSDQEVYQKALNDISLYRQGEMRITVQDDKGNPLPGYQVSYRQTSHDFLFGGVADPFYASRLRQAGINTMTAYVWWRNTEPEHGQFDLEFTNDWLGIDELKTGGMKIKTNNLFSLGEDMPPFWQNVPYAEFTRRVSEHVATIVKRFAPSVDYWEAALEPNFGNHNPLNLTKDEYYGAISTSIAAIRANDPTAIIEINLSYPCGGIDWLDNFQIVQEMLDRQIDFDVIGLQFYYNAYIAAGNYQMPKMSLSEMSACYDRYEEMLIPYGKRVVGSEFSVPSDAPVGQHGYWDQPWSESTQAQYLETAFTIFFSKPTNLGLVWWNTVEPSPFIYHGGLLNDDGTPKPAFHALQNLIAGWTTSGDVVADANGNTTFKGFGGDYTIEIIDPATGSSMIEQMHLTEQKSTSRVVKFTPNGWLIEPKNRLEKLVTYWETKADAARVQKGRDYLALVNHHMQSSEWTFAQRALSAAFDELAITTEIVIPSQSLIPVGYRGEGYTTENGSNLIWGSTALHYPYDFPAGTVTVEITAHSRNEKGESPIMVAGVGANYSPVWNVENEQAQVYTFTVMTTGGEQDLTIRFPYDDRLYERISALGGQAGELKLFIDKVKLIIKSSGD